MKKFIYFLQYLGVRILWLPVQILPPSCAYKIGAAVGWCWFWGSSVRRKVAIENILAAGVATTRSEARRLACRATMHFPAHLLEAGRFARVAATAPWQQFLDMSNLRNGSLELLQKPGIPVLLISPHIGAWEAANYVADAFKPVTGVARTLNNPYIQRFFSGGILRSNFEVIPKQQGLSAKVIHKWEREGRILGIMCDQHAGRHGIWVDFMGRPAATFTTPARLHLATGHPIVTCAFIRTGPFRYAFHGDVLNFTPTGHRDADIRSLTEAINQRFEASVRRFPEQYLWSHRRWRKPPEKQ